MRHSTRVSYHMFSYIVISCSIQNVVRDERQRSKKWGKKLRLKQRLRLAFLFAVSFLVARCLWEAIPDCIKIVFSWQSNLKHRLFKIKTRSFLFRLFIIFWIFSCRGFNSILRRITCLLSDFWRFLLYSRSAFILLIVIFFGIVECNRFFLNKFKVS